LIPGPEGLGFRGCALQLTSDSSFFFICG